MITFTPGEGGGSGIAMVSFVWPTNDTGGKVLDTMSRAALSALVAAGYTVTRKPAFHDLAPADPSGYTFRFTVPAVPPVPTPEEAP